MGNRFIFYIAGNEPHDGCDEKNGGNVIKRNMPGDYATVKHIGKSEQQGHRYIRQTSASKSAGHGQRTVPESARLPRFGHQGASEFLKSWRRFEHRLKKSLRSPVSAKSSFARERK